MQVVYAVTAAVLMSGTMMLMNCGQWHTEEWDRIRLLALGSLLILGILPSVQFVFLHWDEPDLVVFGTMVAEAYVLPTVCMSMCATLLRMIMPMGVAWRTVCGKM
jgi:hypothetical protein